MGIVQFGTILKFSSQENFFQIIWLEHNLGMWLF